MSVHLMQRENFYSLINESTPYSFHYTRSTGRLLRTTKRLLNIAIRDCVLIFKQVLIYFSEQICKFQLF